MSRRKTPKATIDADGWVLEIADHPRQLRKDLIGKPIQLCATIARNWEADDDETLVWSFTLRAGAHQYLIDTEHLAPHGPYATDAEAKATALRVADEYQRQMLDALREHFAPVPVLRWELRADAFAVARLGEWGLFAHPCAWSIDLDCTPVKENEPSGASIEANQRAAEAALGSLGVTFRTEGE